MKEEQAMNNNMVDKCWTMGGYIDGLLMAKVKEKVSVSYQWSINHRQLITMVLVKSKPSEPITTDPNFTAARH